MKETVPERVNPVPGPADVLKESDVLVLSGAEYILNSTDWLRWGPLDEWQWCHEQPRALARIRALENTVGLAMACQWGEDGAYTKFGHSCIVSPSGRVLGGRWRPASRDLSGGRQARDRSGCPGTA